MSNKDNTIIDTVLGHEVEEQDFDDYMKALNGEKKPYRIPGATAAEQKEVDDAVKFALGELQPHAAEVNPPKASDRLVTEADARIAAASALELPAGATPEQRENFEKLRKIAMQKAGK